MCVLIKNSRSRVIGSALKEIFKNDDPFIKLFERSEWRNSTLVEVHHQVVGQLLCMGLAQKAKEISRMILMLDVRPDTWRKIQFDHISLFSNITCPSCSLLFCLQCGYEAHINRTCEENMNYLIYSNKDHDLIQTLTWALENR